MRKKKQRLFTVVDGVSVPVFIGHRYIPKHVLPLKMLHTEYSKHDRLRVFAHKGCHCVVCGAVGTRLIIGKEWSRDVYHIDLYTEDFLLMTVDHRIPKSQGGTSDLSNLDPMCERCNLRKGVRPPGEIKYNKYFIK